ncbi:unnamed protein product [Candidula unifasciata]|uniref:G-protein coupled receptors family 1 profile domain-containing protein n=1 Tax=Candidula unifasciata TaxID=100452 RepID=A0A8S3Z043_9EUPU|nr:unnamed protein product [Candidula unifasciata]
MGKETYIELIIQFMTNNNHTGIDFREPFVKPSLRYVYPLFMFLHATVGVVGVAGNAAMVIIIGKHRLYQDQTYFLMTNLAMADLIKCMVVLPITLANLLIQNWLFGSFLCFFLPMLQCFPVHVSMLTFLTIAIDRYRLIVHPFKSRLPAGLCIIAIWVGAACVVLPYAIYIKYIDLGAMLGDRFIGVGICYVFVEKRIEEYIRAMFVILYAMPLAVIALLYVRISAEIKTKETVFISVHYAQNPDLGDNCNRFSRGNISNTWFSTNHNQEHPDSDDDLDIAKEKRTQNYLITMTTLFAACWCPLHILILVNYFVHENEINMSHYDITYILFTWFGFLSTCSTPVLFASWFMSDATKDRLRGYFRFSNRRRSSVTTQRRRCQSRFSEGSHNRHFDEGIAIECRSAERYGCDSV